MGFKLGQCVHGVLNNLPGFAPIGNASRGGQALDGIQWRGFAVTCKCGAVLAVGVWAEGDIVKRRGLPPDTPKAAETAEVKFALWFQTF